MRYLLAIYMNDAMPPSTDAEAKHALDACFAYTSELEWSGRMLGGDALQPTPTAVSVRLDRDQRPVMSDGPFAETKEQLGGYYVVDGESREEAVAWAAKAPHLSQGGTAEVRQLMEFDR